MKVGRVQTPTLAMLVDREMKINDFKKETYYIAHILGNGIDAVSEHIGDKSQADSVAKECKNEQATVTSVVSIIPRIAYWLQWIKLEVRICQMMLNAKVWGLRQLEQIL